MLKFNAPFENAVFVCTHQRPEDHPKPCCGRRGGQQLREELREMVKAKGLEMQVKVFTSGCIGGCEQGPVALRYPTGELMLGVDRDDLASILEAATGDD